MLFAIAIAAALTVAPPEAGPSGCDGDSHCAELSAAQMFALADKLFESGDKDGAAGILRALTQDKHVELRAEARFRLAALLEQMGDLRGAADNLRALLTEQPDANPARLELARILDRMGDAKAAKRELAKAEAIGLPPEVAVNVRRFAGRLAQATKHRGLTIELTAGPDTNINRSTSSPFIDTIIAPFELSADARRIGGVGLSASGRGYSRDAVGPIVWLSRLNGRADLYDKSRFDDIQLSADSGPEFALGKSRLRPSALIERRWYGGDLYAKGLGGDVSLLAPLSAKTQIEVRASRVRQAIVPNREQDGRRSAYEVSLTHAFTPRWTAQLSLRHAGLDARTKPESVRSWSGAVVLAYQGKAATLFGEADYTATHGLAPLFLFGDERRDKRWDLTGGAVLTKSVMAGFQPIVRATYSDSRADIVLWDYRRFRLDVGLTRNF
jgi:hypothetical protein